MIKKIVLGVLTLIVIGVVALFAVNGKDNYDATKYSATATDGLNVGSKLEFTLPDQFDKPHSLTDDTKKLILVFAKSTGHTVKEFLKKQPKDYLTKKNTLFVADISPMPTVIRNTFALPDFKKSNYSVLLIYDENIAKTLKNPKEADKIAIANLKNKEITSIKYITTIDELKSELQ
ncbi:MAG: hypothetical protein GXO60_02505 [Epsilonproteobacteria bacterium]|nr:hypothetical protein [Campylobacterota bacterium]